MIFEPPQIMGTTEVIENSEMVTFIPQSQHKSHRPMSSSHDESEKTQQLPPLTTSKPSKKVVSCDSTTSVKSAMLLSSSFPSQAFTTPHCFQVPNSRTSSSKEITLSTVATQPKPSARPHVFDKAPPRDDQIQNTYNHASIINEFRGSICVPYAVGDGCTVYNPMIGALIPRCHDKGHLIQNVYGSNKSKSGDKRKRGYAAESALSGAPSKKLKKGNVDNVTQQQQQHNNKGSKHKDDNFIDDQTTLSWFELDTQTKKPKVQHLIFGLEPWHMMTVCAPFAIPPSRLLINGDSSDSSDDEDNYNGNGNHSSDKDPASINMQQRLRFEQPQELTRSFYNHQLKEIEALVGSMEFNSIPFTTELPPNNCIFPKSNISILGSFAGSGKTRVIVATYMIHHFYQQLKRIVQLSSSSSPSSSSATDRSKHTGPQIVTIKTADPYYTQNFQVELVYNCETEKSSINDNDDIMPSSSSSSSSLLTAMSIDRNCVRRAMFVICSESLVQHWRSEILELNQSGFDQNPSIIPRLFETIDGSQSFNPTSHHEEDEDDSYDDDDYNNDDSDDDNGGRGRSSKPVKLENQLPSVCKRAIEHLTRHEYVNSGFATVITITSSTLQRIFPEIGLLSKGQGEDKKRALATKVITTLDEIFRFSANPYPNEWLRVANAHSTTTVNTKSSHPDDQVTLQSMKKVYAEIKKHQKDLVTPNFIVMSSEAFALYNQALVILHVPTTHNFQHVVIDEVCDLPLPTIPQFEHLTLVSSTAITKLKRDTINNTIQRDSTTKPNQTAERLRLSGLAKIPRLLAGGVSTVMTEDNDNINPDNDNLRMRLATDLITKSITRVDLNSRHINSSSSPSEGSFMYQCLKGFKKVGLPIIMSSPDFIRDSIKIREVTVRVIDLFRVDCASVHFLNEIVMDSSFPGGAGKGVDRRSKVILGANTSWCPFMATEMMEIFKTYLNRLIRQARSMKKLKGSQEDLDLPSDLNDLDSIVSDDEDFTLLLMSNDEFSAQELHEVSEKYDGCNINDSSTSIGHIIDEKHDQDDGNDDNDDDDEEPEEPCPTPTRKRGRPRKYADSIYQQPTHPKKKRGRPSKQLKTDDVEMEPSSSSSMSSPHTMEPRTQESNNSLKQRMTRRDEKRWLKIRHARLDFLKFLRYHDDSMMIPRSLVGGVKMPKLQLQAELNDRPELNADKVRSWGFARYVREIHLLATLFLSRGGTELSDRFPSNLIKAFMFGCCTQCNRPCVKESVQVPLEAFQKYILNSDQKTITSILANCEDDDDNNDTLTPEEDRQLRQRAVNRNDLTPEQMILRRKRAIEQRNAPIPRSLIEHYGEKHAQLPWFTCATCCIVQCGQCSLNIPGFDLPNACGICFSVMKPVGLGFKNDARIYNDASKIVKYSQTTPKGGCGNGSESCLFPSSAYDEKNDTMVHMCLKTRLSVDFEAQSTTNKVPKYVLRLNPFESTIFVIHSIATDKSRLNSNYPTSIVVCLPNEHAINSARSILCTSPNFTCFLTGEIPKKQNKEFGSVKIFTQCASNDEKCDKILVLFLSTSNTDSWVGLDLNMVTDFILPIYVSENSSHQFINRVLRQHRSKDLNVHRIHSIGVEL